MSRWEETAHELEVVTGQRNFPDYYKDQIFYVWFEAGKPGASSLRKIIQPLQGTTLVPSVSILHKWIHEEFQSKAEELDIQITQTFNDQVVASKVEMLQRHIEIGKKMQEVAIGWIESNLESMNPNAAVRLLVEGLRVERESAGIPEALEKLTTMSDEDLLQEINDLISNSPTKVEPNV